MLVFNALNMFMRRSVPRSGNWFNRVYLSWVIKGLTLLL